jgi:predicted AAA+ superfamily ATPase
VRTEKQHKNIVALSDIRREKQIASSVYGPRRAGLTTSRIIEKDQVLTELLNYLERLIQDLNFKSFEAYDTFNIAMEEMRAALSNIIIEEGGTDV